MLRKVFLQLLSRVLFMGAPVFVTLSIILLAVLCFFDNAQTAVIVNSTSFRVVLLLILAAYVLTWLHEAWIAQVLGMQLISALQFQLLITIRRRHEMQMSIMPL